jgi:hypothetical protein
MKTKMLVLAALVGVAALSAKAGVGINVSIGLPSPVIVSHPVVVAAPVPPPPSAVVETVPACPSPDYVWVAGYWAYRPSGYFWVHGGWNHRPAQVMRGHYYGGGYGGHRW